MAALSNRLTPFHEESVVVMNSFPKSSLSQQQAHPLDQAAPLSLQEDNVPPSSLFNDEPKIPFGSFGDHDTEDERSGKGSSVAVFAYDSELELPDTTSRESGAPKSPKTTKKRLFFTKEEDDSIINGYKMYGPDWDKILLTSRLQRTPEQIKNRYKRIIKKQEKVALPTQQSLSATSSGTTSASSTQGTIMKFIQTQQPDQQDQQDTSLKRPRADAVLQRRIAELEAEETKWREQATAKSAEIARLEKEIREIKLNWQADRERTNDVVRQLLVDREVLEREKVRKKLAKHNTTLGYCTSKQSGYRIYESFVEGTKLRRTSQRLSRLQFERESIEAQRKNYKKVKDSSPQEELCSIRLGELKKKEVEIMREKAILNAKKALHIRETKRIAAENQSEYKDFPYLNERYLLLSLLGKGGFSEVYLAYDLQEYRHVAVKIHSLNKRWEKEVSENYLKHSLRELSIQKELNHQNIVKLIDVFQNKNSDSFCTVLEYCEGGDLDTHLKERGSLSEREAKLIMIQVFNALDYLASQTHPIIHYDLKPGNILFSNGEAKLTDFGLSKIMEEEGKDIELTSKGAGTYWYLPPECFTMERGSISNKVDIWSAGVIFYQLLYGVKPFANGMPQQQILEQKVMLNIKEITFPDKPVISDEAKDLIRSCLAVVPSSRPSPEQCLAHPCFTRWGKKK